MTISVGKVSARDSALFQRVDLRIALTGARVNACYASSAKAVSSLRSAACRVRQKSTAAGQLDVFASGSGNRRKSLT